MARPVKKSGASRPGQDGSVETRNRVKTSVHLEPEIHKLLAIASIETGLDMSTIVNRLVREPGKKLQKSRAEPAKVGKRLLEVGRREPLERGRASLSSLSGPLIWIMTWL